MRLIECVQNFSEGRDLTVIKQITDSIESIGGITLLDVDPGVDTNRTVVTIVGDPESVIKRFLIKLIQRNAHESFLLSTLVLLSSSIVFSGCQRYQPSQRIPVSCSGPPTKGDYLITTSGDILINNDKCKFKFPQNRKGMDKKPESKDRS